MNQTEAVIVFILHYFCHLPKVKVPSNLSLLRCMLFAKYSRNFYPIFMKFGKHYFLVLRQLPWKVDHLHVVISNYEAPL